MKEVKYKLSPLLFTVSAAAHIFAFIDYKFMIESFTVPEHWHIQFYILLLLSLMISLLLVFIKNFRPFLLLLRFIALLIMGYPLGNFLGIETILLITIILETVYYLNHLHGAYVSVLLILVTFLNQKTFNSWGIESDRVDVHNLLLMLFLSLLVLLISCSLKIIYQSSLQKSRDISRLDYAVKELTKINLGFQHYAASVEHDSIENERKRVSREMHDIIGYTLTNQLMIIQAALSMKETLSPQLKSLLLQAQKQTREGMEDARNALYRLRNFSPQSEIGLKIIYKLTKTFEQVTGVNVAVDFSNLPMSMGNEIDSALFRVVQEGLTNAFHHGKATSIFISLYMGNEIIYISIRDNGRGSEKIHEGIGLKGMRERLESLGGSIETSSQPSGFTIRAQLPCRKKNKDRLYEAAAG